MLFLYYFFFFVFFFFNDTATTEIYTLSLHDALPICGDLHDEHHACALQHAEDRRIGGPRPRDRKSTRLNSSHVEISYAVFCLKKKKKQKNIKIHRVKNKQIETIIAGQYISKLKYRRE